MHDVPSDNSGTVAAPAGNALGIAGAGLVALAVAMGIGRFAFTPILPMMQADAGLSLSVAGWLAAANYLGYLIGALTAARLAVVPAIRGSLVLIAIVTFGMGFGNHFIVWLVLRLLEGIASAWVLVHVSAWTLEQLLARQRSALSGVVFAGVGVGIAGAGVLCMGLMRADIDSAHTWELFGIVSLLLTAAVWMAFGNGAGHGGDSKSAPSRPQHVTWNPDKLLLAACYAAFGFGYIIPATFLPAMARRFVTDPAVFGWAWPVFGAAAALSTFAAARWLHAVDDRRVWAIASMLMAVGVVLPVAWPGLAAILIAALLVGGTFMVITMTGLREARRAAGASTTGFIGAMTAAFAVGQIIGPLVVSAVAGIHYGFAAALIAAAVILALAAAALWRSAGKHPERA